MELYIGPIAALAAALFWAVATLLYNQAGSYLSAAQLNWVKGVVAVPLLALAAWWLPSSLSVASLTDSPALYLLLLSGVIGITIGDTCYFAALRRLGPNQTMLLEYLAPVFAALLAWWWLAETLTLTQVGAAAVVIAGVIWVITGQQSQRIERQGSNQLSAPTQPSVSGVLFGITAALCQAVGLVMAFHALQSFELSALTAALLRMSAGTVALTVALVMLKPAIIGSTRAAMRHTSWRWLLLAIVLGTFGAIWLQQLALTTLSPGLAQTLLATAPLWLIPIQWSLGIRTSWRALSGTLIALSGIIWLFSSL